MVWIREFLYTRFRLVLSLLALSAWVTQSISVQASDNFKPSGELAAAHQTYLQSTKTAQQAFERLQQAEQQLNESRAAYLNKSNELARQDAAFRGNVSLDGEIHEVRRQYKEQTRQLVLERDRYERRIATIADEKVELETATDVVPAIVRAKTQALNLQLKDAQKKLVDRQAKIEKASAARDAKISALQAERKTRRPTAELYEEQQEAYSNLRRRTEELLVEQKEYERHAESAVIATVEFYSQLENNRPPFVRQVKIKHGKDVKYEARWVPGETTSQDSKVIRKVVADGLAQEKLILDLSTHRIEMLESNRREYRVRMNEARAEAQRLQQSISDTEVMEIYVKTGIELAVVGAELAVSGGALTLASQSASLSVQQATKTYSKALLRKQASNPYMMKEIAGLFEKAVAEATVKKMEDAIAQGVSFGGYQDLRKTAMNEAGEWLFSETLSTGMETFRENVIERTGNVAVNTASKTASQGTMSKLAGLIKNQKVSSASKIKTSVASFAAEMAAKLALDYFSSSRVDALGDEKYVKQVEVMITQALWNRVHVALMLERLRNQQIKARIKAIEARLEHGLADLRLEVMSDEILSLEDIARKHVVDIFFETSERLEFAPSIVSFTGFAAEGMERVPKLGENWWKAFAVLDESEHVERLNLPVMFRKSANFNPYSSFDAEPNTVPQIASLEGPTWKGFETGDDRSHRIRLTEQQIASGCALDQAQGDGQNVVAGIVDMPDKPNCSYWGLPGFGVLEMVRSGDTVRVSWAKIFKQTEYWKGRQAYALDDHSRRSNSYYRHWNFTEGPLLDATVLQDDDKDLWDETHFIAAGNLNTEVERYCQPHKDIKTATASLSSKVMLRVLDTRNTIGHKGRGLLHIYFDPSEVFQPETVFEVFSPSGENSTKYIGIPECVRHIHGDNPPYFGSSHISMDMQEMPGRRDLLAVKLDDDVRLEDINAGNLVHFTKDETLPEPRLAPMEITPAEMMKRGKKNIEWLIRIHRQELSFLMRMDDYLPDKGAEWDEVRRHQEHIPTLKSDITIYKQSFGLYE